MMTLAQFRARFPEMNAEDSITSACLDEAELEINASVWGALTNAGHGFLTAHKLAISPFGRQAGLSAKDGSSTYEKQFIELRAQVTCGIARTT